MWSAAGHIIIIIMIIYIQRFSRGCIKSSLGLSVLLLSQGGMKEVSQEAVHPAGLVPSSGDQRCVQGLRRVELGGPGVGAMEPLHGAGQPDESLEALDVSAAVVHQLVFGHSSAARDSKHVQKHNKKRQFNTT